ncbi:hypothetical protein NW762_011118 [Fusarium torreyae]|uniref:galacturonan 1,4-alpha-galacturonidase n=1 Tax=Fusarium torreyae TaxID=1237075 RepID=A0A9W8VAN1_9HYPO|nr:hypothetical protein NW762_011118 [Fusarium torreyae]
MALLVEAAKPKLPTFPQLAAYPKAPAQFQLPQGPNRKKVCMVKSGLADTGPAILKAARTCNEGGNVFFPQGDYTIASTLDLTLLDHVDLAIYGTIYFKDDVTLWFGKTFNYPYQTVSLFWRFGGYNVNIYGGGKGVINGQGSTYWNAMVTDKNVLRPTLFGTDGLHRSSITGLTMKNSPGWFNFISNSPNLLISDLVLDVVVTNASTPAKNTDAWDTYRSNNIVIQNSNITVYLSSPTPSRSLSKGLIALVPTASRWATSANTLARVDIVEDLYIHNNTMRSATNAARVKVWLGVPPNSGIVDAGGGGDRVRNVTYERFHSVGNDHAIAITQCYYTKNQSQCDEYPAKLTIEDIELLDFTGTISKKYASRLGELICSFPDVCSNIQAHNINVSPPGSEYGY